MANDRYIDDDMLQQLIDANIEGVHGKRNAALIMAAVYWGLTPAELSLIVIGDVVDKDGRIKKPWTLPGATAFNGVERKVYTDGHVETFFEGYLDWRVQKSIHLGSNHEYRGLDPVSAFFLNDRGEPYALSLRRKGTENLQPRSMNQQLTRMIENARLSNVSPSTFRDSFIYGIYMNGCGWELMKEVTGIRQKRTLERKVRPREQSINKVFESLFSKLKYPF